MRFAIVVCALAGCAKPPETPGWQLPGLVHATRATPPPAPIAHATAAAVPPAIVPEAERFRVAVVELGLEPDFAKALRCLADALEVVAPSHGEDIRLVRGAAADHHNFPRTSQRAAWIRDALDAAARSLSAGSPPSKDALPDYEVAVADVVATTHAVDPAKPLRDQLPQLRTAFGALARAVAIGTGLPAKNDQQVLRFRLRNPPHRG